MISSLFLVHSCLQPCLVLLQEVDELSERKWNYCQYGNTHGTAATWQWVSPPGETVPPAPPGETVSPLVPAPPGETVSPLVPATPEEATICSVGGSSASTDIKVSSNKKFKRKGSNPENNPLIGLESIPNYRFFWSCCWKSITFLACLVHILCTHSLKYSLIITLPFVICLPVLAFIPCFLVKYYIVPQAVFVFQCFWSYFLKYRSYNTVKAAYSRQFSR